MRTMTALPMAVMAGTLGIAMAANAQQAGSHAAVDGDVDAYTLQTIDDADRANALEAQRERTRTIMRQGETVVIVDGEGYDPSSAQMGNRDAGMAGSRELQEEQDGTTTRSEARALSAGSGDGSSATMGNRDAGMAGSRELQEEQDGTTTRSESRALSAGSGDASSATMGNRDAGMSGSRELQEEQDGTTTSTESRALSN